MGLNIIGKGIYTISEAAYLIGLSSRRIRPWIKGYSSRSNTGKISNIPPLIVSSIPIVDQKDVISFVELVELRFVKEFRKRGVSFQVIRRAAKEASKILQVTHPFAYKRFKTDCKSIFLHYSQCEGQKDLILLGKSQYVMEEIIKVYLHEVDFDDLTDLALRWWPMGRENHIVIDPQVAFGSPVIESTRITTETVYKDYLAEDSIKKIAIWYDIKPSKIQSAIDFMKILKL